MEFQSQEERGLFEQLADINSLRQAFLAVKANKGAAGVDGVSVADFESRLAEELDRLRNELLQWCYKPQPVRAVEIPKPTGGTRRLGIPSVRDRVVQAAIKALLEPLFEPSFSEQSFGFRPGRNQHQAITSAQTFVRSGKVHVVDIDLEKFFDRIHHDRLIARLRPRVGDVRILRLIGITLRSGIMKDGVFASSPEGVMQGSPLSPLLSNVVLDELDKEIERRQLSFCRYADDCNIFVGSAKAAGRILEGLTSFIEKKLKLKVNRDKSKASTAPKVKFLGFNVAADGTVRISTPSVDRAWQKLRELIPRRSHLTLKQTIAKFNSWYRGWHAYYGLTDKRYQLRELEAHARRRLRARIAVQAKRPATLVKLLRKQGVPANLARKVYNKGPWALSHSQALDSGFRNGWFVRQGLLLLSPNKHHVALTKVKLIPCDQH